MSFHEGSPADGWANARLLHRKVHSAPTRLRKDALCDPRVAQSALFPSRCGVREVWANRPPGCGVPWKIAQLGKCVRATPRQAAGRVAPGSADLSLGLDLTEKRTLAATPLTKRRILYASSRAECAFPVTLRCPGSVGQPPARLRGTLENSPTGQMRSSNPPPGCGAGCSRVCRPLSGA